MLRLRFGGIRQTRGLFKGPKFNILEKDSVHHEYSIRPDTFAFKVSASNDNTRALVSKNQPKPPSTPHPLQKDGNTEFTGFNLVDFVYKNATNYPFENKTPQEVFNTYATTNSSKLARLKHRPKKAKMLVSDFIEDSLYNPNYGYFSHEVEIFHPDKPFDYSNIDDVDEFLENWKAAYTKYDQQPVQARAQEKKETKVPKETTDRRVVKPTNTKKEVAPSKFASRAQKVYRDDLAVAGTSKLSKRSSQLWHTPTELFQPHYGEALARYILVNYKLNGSYPYEDLVIYEMGGGNGTLMCNVLNFIKENEPEIYAQTHYKIIEISSQLAVKQTESAFNAKLSQQGLDSSKFEIINKSIFDWDKVVTSPCFFIALEVFDNFAHDLIRYDNKTGIPHQGYVLVDEHNDFYEFFTPELTYYLNAFLNLRENGQYPVLKKADSLYAKAKTAKSLIPFINKDDVHPLYQSSFKLKWKNTIAPFKDDLTPGEFIPTRLLEFFQILKHRFPNHSLISSDFNYLPNAMKGHFNSPVVQTIIQNRMIDVSTYMCHQGYFDIMFPTDFKLASDLYKQVTGKVARVELHHDFLYQWADVDATTTKKGENPMLDFYRNVSFMVS